MDAETLAELQADMDAAERAGSAASGSGPALPPWWTSDEDASAEAASFALAVSPHRRGP